MRDLQRPVWHGVRSTPQNVHPRAALWTIPEAPARLAPRGGLQPAPNMLYYDILIRPGNCRKMGASSPRRLIRAFAPHTDRVP